jgi:acyl-CoA reductase-like NAD-dependent aldehyde dehydrogenase
MSTPASTLKTFSSYAIKATVPAPAASARDQLDAAVERLRDGARRFARLDTASRIQLVVSMQQGMMRVAPRMVAAGCQAKGIVADTPLEAEEWATGPWAVVRQLRLLREQLTSIAESGNTSIGPLRRTIDGQLSVNVFPGNGIDRVLFKNITVDVRMLASVTEDGLHESRASYYKREHADSPIVLILGAGNIAAIAPMDVLTKMFNEGAVCLLKMNPVNAYLGPLIEEAFAEAVRQHFLAIVYGGAEEGDYLGTHAGIDQIHLTGSDRTHDAIVWGPPGPDRDDRKRRNVPRLSKPLTSELGNISPILLVPGPYSEKELQYQAEDAASYLVMNASFLCNAAKMLVLPRGWGGSDRFVDGIAQFCETVPPRVAYYPGANERWQMLTAGRSEVRRIGVTRTNSLPWTIISGLDADATVEPLFALEPFCPILGETRVGSADPIEYLAQAVEFCNQKLWGTLSATLVVHPESLKDPMIAEAVEYAIARLRYGTVSVNGFAGMSFAFASPPWGAYPGAHIDDIQSGAGFVHNTPMLAGIEKAVIRYPLTNFPKPGYFPSHRTSHRIMRSLVSMDCNASWSRVPGIVLNAMLG